MNFWASWCVPCREEMPAFDLVSRRHPGILFLGVAVQDTESAAQGFAEEVGVSYPLGHDTEGEILERYPILGVPTTWFITSDGTLAARWAGQLDQDRLEDLVEQHLTG
ncbi:MAG: redoxin domain-containing protein [Acidimicrobiia bacterium]|nr:redoxin domain-containing protein [Acidimicrobiia bacterium]